jgi:hypothetical protein
MSTEARSESPATSRSRPVVLTWMMQERVCLWRLPTSARQSGVRWQLAWSFNRWQPCHSSLRTAGIPHMIDLKDASVRDRIVLIYCVLGYSMGEYDDKLFHRE